MGEKEITLVGCGKGSWCQPMAEGLPGRHGAYPKHKAQSYGMPARCSVCLYTSMKLRELLKPGTAQRHSQTVGIHSRTILFSAEQLHREDLLCSQPTPKVGQAT